MDRAMEQPVPTASYVAVGVSILFLLVSWAMYIALVVYSAKEEEAGGSASGSAGGSASGSGNSNGAWPA